MARRAAPKSGRDDLVSNLISKLNKDATGVGAYLQGDHAQHTWGVKIPHMIFQYLIGGSTVLPCQRFLGVSGLEKSFKSTLITEWGNWFIESGGIHVLADTELKTSADMLDAMTWMRSQQTGIDYSKFRIFKPCRSIEEWQNTCTDAVKLAKKTASSDKGARMPILISIDSLTGSSEKAQETVAKEGSAQGRSYDPAIAAAQITNYFDTVNLLGTTANIAYVQHMKQDMESQGHGGPTFHEKGAKAVAFRTSIHLRVRKFGAVHVASHASAPNKDIPVEGYQLQITSHRSCVGPDGNVIILDLLWQYVPQEDGSTRQVMWFDWNGALGRYLCDIKYSEKLKTFAYERDRLEALLSFTQPKTGRINCKDLGLEEASLTEFGKAIIDSPELSAAVARYLNIRQYPDVQDAEIALVDGGTEE